MKKRIISFITAICLTVAVLPFKNYIDLFKNSMTAEAYAHINEYPDFSLDMYVADLMTNTSKEDYSYKMLSYFINEYVSPNSIFFENLRDDKTFRNSVTAWETSNAIFDPGAEETKTLDEVGYYEAIILNALNASFQSYEFYSGYMKKAYNDVDNIYSYFEDNSELSYFISNYKKLTDSELKDFGNAFEKAYEQSFPGLSLFSNSMDIIKSFFKVCDTLYELVDKIVAYYICNQMSDEMKLFVHNLYDSCNGTQNPAMKLALSNIAVACDNYELSVADAVSDTTFKVGVQTLSKVGDKFMKGCISYFPAGKVILLTQAITKSAVNFILSTDKIIEQYYKMYRLYEFEMLVRETLKSQMAGYQSSPSVENANLLFAEIDVFFNTLDISHQYVSDFAKLMFETNIIGRLFGDTNEYNELMYWNSGGRSSAKQVHDNIRNTHYLYMLEGEYPEIYEAYCKQNGAPSVPKHIKALGVEFEKEEIEIGLEDSFGLVYANVLPKNATNQLINYTVSNPEIANYSFGSIRPYAVGTTVITATTVDGGYIDELIVNVVEGHGKDGTPPINPTQIGSAEIGDIFETDGLQYKIISDSSVELSRYTKEPIGTLIIPGTVSYKGKLFNVETMSNAWQSYSYDLPSGGWGVKNGGVFNQCKYITNIILPEGLTNIGNEAFTHCESLTSLTIPSSIKVIGEYAFEYSPNLKTVYFSDGLETIKVGAFRGCTNLKSIIIPDSVTSIERAAFDYCSKLESAILSSSITQIEKYTFEGCSNLIKIEIPDNVTNIGEYAFSKCTSLENIYISNNVTSIGEYAFSECSNLNTVYLSNSVVNIGEYIFSECIGLCEVHISTGLTKISDCAFYNCSSLSAIEIPSNVTSIGTWAFRGCSNLASVTLPNNLKSIGVSAFGECTSLSTIAIPQTMRNLDNYIFYNCSELSSITIPNSISTINYGAFEGVTNLKDIYYLGTEDEWNNISIITFINDGNKNLYSATIHYNYVPPQGDVNMDGSFNVADVVLLQKWLLAVPDVKLANWKAADLCEDDRLDVFDLCLMKRLLLNS